MKLEAKWPGATVVPIMLSSDKTQVTMFRNKAAYPIYMTIGNIPKDIRRKPSHHAQILLAYLPTTRLDHISNQSARRRTLNNLVHACIGHILQPLQLAGNRGMELCGGDGILRRGHPILACYIGDYPEQVLVSGTITGDCPKCDILRDELGSPDAPFELRDLQNILAALSQVDEDPVAFARACHERRIKPVLGPFWVNLPFANIFDSLTPDVLHQLYQGIIKHCISWLRQAFGEAEINARCRRLPPNHNIRLFMKGIFGLARVSGAEHKQICRFLLGVIVDMPLPNGASPIRLVRTLCALLDFLYLAQYPQHTDSTLQLLDDALERFHTNKEIFVELGIRSAFNLPKLHACRHYADMIRRFGTTDNYNTEYTKRLHIDLAKDAYRATNHKGEYDQMTLWLERREKIIWHSNFIAWRQQGNSFPSTCLGVQRSAECQREYKIAKHPSARWVSIEALGTDYGAHFFLPALARFVVRVASPQLSSAQLENSAARIVLPIHAVHVYHKIRYHNKNCSPSESNEPGATVDSIHARPKCRDGQGRDIPARFDTGLVYTHNEAQRRVDRTSFILDILLCHY